MIIRARLPMNRRLPGVLTLEDDGTVLLGPYPCRGKADGAVAEFHGNAQRLPWIPYGDHPAGAYRVVLVQRDKPPHRTYGPFFILLDPVSGDAARAKMNGRTGIAIHGGDAVADGSLRATEGCLRTTNEAVTFLAALVAPGTQYICQDAV